MKDIAKQLKDVSKPYSSGWENRPRNNYGYGTKYNNASYRPSGQKRSYEPQASKNYQAAPYNNRSRGQQHKKFGRN